MKINERPRRRDGASSSGKIMGGPDHELFHSQIKTLVNEGYVDVVLNMSKINWINSTGLGVLVPVSHRQEKRRTDEDLLGQRPHRQHSERDPAEAGLRNLRNRKRRSRGPGCFGIGRRPWNRHLRGRGGMETKARTKPITPLVTVDGVVLCCCRDAPRMRSHWNILLIRRPILPSRGLGVSRRIRRCGEDLNAAVHRRSRRRPD